MSPETAALLADCRLFCADLSNLWRAYHKQEPKARYGHLIARADELVRRIDATVDATAGADVG